MSILTNVFCGTVSEDNVLKFKEHLKGGWFSRSLSVGTVPIMVPVSAKEKKKEERNRSKKTTQQSLVSMTFLMARLEKKKDLLKKKRR